MPKTLRKKTSFSENYQFTDKEGATRILQRPQVLGMCTEKNISQFFIVTPGSYIWSGEWAAYITRSNFGYVHDTVNHSENFIDPTSGANTQRIECPCKQGNLWPSMLNGRGIYFKEP